MLIMYSVLRLDNDGAVQVVLTTSHTAPPSLTGSPLTRRGPQSQITMLPVGGTAGAVAFGSSNQKGFFDGVFGCLRPVLSFIGKTTVAELKQQGDHSRVWSTLPEIFTLT